MGACERRSFERQRSLEDQDFVRVGEGGLYGLPCRLPHSSGQRLRPVMSLFSSYLMSVDSPTRGHVSQGR
jgi:hypothetical protein